MAWVISLEMVVFTNCLIPRKDDVVIDYNLIIWLHCPICFWVFFFIHLSCFCLLDFICHVYLCIHLSCFCASAFMSVVFQQSSHLHASVMFLSIYIHLSCTYQFICLIYCLAPDLITDCISSPQQGISPPVTPYCYRMMNQCLTLIDLLSWLLHTVWPPTIQEDSGIL